MLDDSQRDLEIVEILRREVFKLSQVGGWLKREEQIERVVERQSGRFVLDEGRRGIWSSSASCSLHPSCVLPLRRPFFFHPRKRHVARWRGRWSSKVFGGGGEGTDVILAAASLGVLCDRGHGMLKRTIAAREYKYILRERVK